MSNVKKLSDYKTQDAQITDTLSFRVNAVLERARELNTLENQMAKVIGFKPWHGPQA